MRSHSLIIGENVSFQTSLLTHHFFEKNVEMYPLFPAITDRNGTIHYKELNEVANQLAWYLKEEEKISYQDRVAVCISPSIELLIAVLAILKIGAVYIPLDISYPEKSGCFILDDAKPKVMLTNNVCPFSYERIIDIHEINLKNYPSHNTNQSFNSQSVAYILYTSGSTGNPKGVMIPHSAVVNHMLWMQQEFNVNSTDKILLKTALTFDPSVWEMLLPLFAAAELVVAPTGCQIDTQLLVNTIIQYQITIVQFVPILLHKFLTHPQVSECVSLKRVFVGGESLPGPIKKLFFENLNAELVNLYGPTETTIDVIYHRVNPDEELDKNYIGKPIYNTTLCIIDEQGKDCEIDEPGELYISGSCLGLGYLNRDDLTEKLFIKNPFLENQKMYKTGDFVSLRKNGLIEYLGRKDNQVKINGVRIELDDIISKILMDQSIEHCTVIQNKGDGPIDYLIAYIVPKIGKNVDLARLRRTLAQSLHNSLIPRVFHLIPCIPILHNGKIDMRQLKQYAEDRSYLPEKKKDIQTELLTFCRELINNQQLSVSDDLYYCGIDSLFWFFLINHIEKIYGINLMIHEVLMHTTLQKITTLLIEKLKCGPCTENSIKTLIALKETGYKTPLFLIHPIGGTIFWYLHVARYFDPNRPLYGIQDPGLESDNFAFKSIQEMAKFYFKQIQSVQPKGPYLIGGASFGATIAVEICRHLKTEEVITIPILDGWGIYPNELKDEDYFRKSMLKQQQDWKDKFGVHDYQDHKRIFATQRHRLELLYQYKMNPVAHDILLLKSKEISDIFKPINCVDNNWGKYAKGQLEIINVEGDHESMFQMPQVQRLAVKLTNALNTITSDKTEKFTT